MTLWLAQHKHLIGFAVVILALALGHAVSASFYRGKL